MVKISYVMNIYNGEPFLYYNLKSIYEHAFEIIIVEGAYEGFSENPHSTDKTIEIIKEYPDPQKKIKLISKDNFWKDREDMCNAFLKEVRGDVIWQLDYDEFYFDETHKFVKELFELYEDLDLIIFPLKDFFGSLDYAIGGYISVAGLSKVRRIFRYYPEAVWKTQRPPTLAYPDGREIVSRRIIDAEYMEANGHFMWHYSTIFRNQLLNKIQYYEKLHKSFVSRENFLTFVWDNFKNPFNVSMSNVGLSYLIKYEGPHPRVIYEMIGEIDNKDFTFHPQFKKIENYITSPLYDFDIFIVKVWNNLLFKRKVTPLLLLVLPLSVVGAIFSSRYRFIFEVFFNKTSNFLKKT
jgi:hypothetical protein